MAVTLLGTPDAASTGTAPSVSVNLPAGIQAGDVGVAVVVYAQNNGDPATPSGWTQMTPGEVSPTSSMRVRFYYRVMAGGESGTVTFTHPSAQKQSAAVAVLRGVTGPPTLATSSGSDANPTNTVAASSVGVSVWVERGGTAPTSMSSGPSGFTVHDSSFATGGGSTAASIASNLTPSSSSVGGGSWTPNVSNSTTVTATFALAVTPDPASGASTGALVWSGTAVGSRSSAGNSAGALAFVGTAAGARASSGTSAGTLAWVGAGAGARPSAGASAGSLTWTGTADGHAPGVSPAEGSSAGTLSWAGSASGARPSAGTSVGTLSWAGSAAGARPSTGASDGELGWDGVGSGVRASLGSSLGTVLWEGVASGSSREQRDISGGVTLLADRARTSLTTPRGAAATLARDRALVTLDQES